MDPDWGFQGFTAVERHTNCDESPYQRLMRSGASEQPTDRRLARHSPTIVARLRDILATCRRGVGLSPGDRERLGMGKRTITPLDGHAPAPTVTTLPDDLVHYSDPRTMSVREHARLQSFPDWFSFCGPYTSGGSQRRRACPRYTQVGNAVPPLLAEGLGETLIGLLGGPEAPVAGECAGGARGNPTETLRSPAPLSRPSAVVAKSSTRRWFVLRARAPRCFEFQGPGLGTLEFPAVSL